MTHASNADHYIRDGLEIKRRITADSEVAGSLLGQPGRIFRIEVTSEIDEAAGRFTVRRVVVEAEDGGEVTAGVLRAVKSAGVLNAALRDWSGAAGQEPADLLEMGQAGPVDETLRAVARVYSLALLLGEAPTQRVTEAFGIPRSTAGRWVMRARDRGFLTVTDPRAPGSAAKKRNADG